MIVPWLLLLLSLPTAGAADPIDDDLRLNQVQVIGTHNSYHLAPSPGVMGMIAQLSPRQAEAIDYSHRPLAEQFGTLLIRQIELDVFADPDGGRYARPMAREALIGRGEDPGPDPNRDGVLNPPGPKVLHVQDIDYLTTAATLADALAQVRDWSKANPQHVPILILIELKDRAVPGLSQPAPIGAEALAEIERTLRSAFEPDHLLTPDDVRGDFDTLPEALNARGWPRLAEVRGRVVFALDNTDRIRDLYLDGHPNLAGRVMFADAGSTDHPAASWFKRNDPIGQFDEIQRLVRAGFLVRTRADADTRQARSGDTTQRDRAFASGAQFVSTDYPEPDPRFTEYRVTLPDQAEAIPNPVALGSDTGGQAIP
ncbi:Ca2+-dependent phosphoinositide-specific phospholipase C [Tautonia rosea]|uniref:Ca2+-dependent phosphoinositide-specific phospholipase C n=1 Tax=Tautonia rosea TaxID=2728037 RepID=UPI001472717B|nr:Ca2+-dependent phosphoinositide-specific phospholipase C [Tautonia rosea]